MSSMEMQPISAPDFQEELLVAAVEIMKGEPSPSLRESLYEDLLLSYGKAGDFCFTNNCYVNLSYLAQAISDADFLRMMSLDEDFASSNF